MILIYCDAKHSADNENSTRSFSETDWELGTVETDSLVGENCANGGDVDRISESSGSQAATEEAAYKHGEKTKKKKKRTVKSHALLVHNT